MSLISKESNDTSEKRNFVFIGNGLDISLGLRSGYSHFLAEISNEQGLISNEDIYKYNRLFVRNFSGEELNWSDFETIFEHQIQNINQSNNIGNLTHTKEFLINQVNDDLNQLERDFTHYLQKEYDQWKTQITSKKFQLNSLYKKIFGNESTVLVSFNYTNAISDLKKICTEDIYEKKGFDAYQIHGSLKENNIVFGGNFAEDETSINITILGSTENDKFVRTKKDRFLSDRREKLMTFTKKPNKVGDVFILGHSLVGSDFGFLKHFFEESDKIFLFYYKDDYNKKLQFMLKNLGREVIEKVTLIPFLDALIPIHSEEKISISKEGTEYDSLKRIFDFAMPPPEGWFEAFELLPDHFILKQFSHINIENTRMSKEACQLFKKLDTNILDNINRDISISLSNIGTEDNKAKDKETAFDKLMNDPFFHRLVSIAYKIEITDCNFAFENILSALEQNGKLHYLQINGCVITCSMSEFNTSSISNLNSISLINNEFHFVKKGTKEKNSMENVAYNILSKENNTNLLNVIVKENINLIIPTQINHPLSGAKHIILTIDSLEDMLTFPAVEKLELIGSDSKPELKNILLSKNVKEIKISNFTITTGLFISSLFDIESSRKAILPNLQHLTFEECEIIEVNKDNNESKAVDSGEIILDFICNIFTKNNPFFKWGNNKSVSKEIFQEEMAILKISNRKITYTQEPKKEYSENLEGFVPNQKATISQKYYPFDKEYLQIIDDNTAEKSITSFMGTFSRMSKPVTKINMSDIKGKHISDAIYYLTDKAALQLNLNYNSLWISIKNYEYNSNNVPYIDTLIGIIDKHGKEQFEKDFKSKYRNKQTVLQSLIINLIKNVLLPLIPNSTTGGIYNEKEKARA